MTCRKAAIRSSSTGVVLVACSDGRSSVAASDALITKNPTITSGNREPPNLLPKFMFLDLSVVENEHQIHFLLCIIIKFLVV